MRGGGAGGHDQVEKPYKGREERIQEKRKKDEDQPTEEVEGSAQEKGGTETGENGRIGDILLSDQGVH